MLVSRTYRKKNLRKRRRQALLYKQNHNTRQDITHLGRETRGDLAVRELPVRDSVSLHGRHCFVHPAKRSRQARSQDWQDVLKVSPPRSLSRTTCCQHEPKHNVQHHRVSTQMCAVTTEIATIYNGESARRTQAKMQKKGGIEKKRAVSLISSCALFSSWRSCSSRPPCPDLCAPYSTLPLCLQPCQTLVGVGTPDARSGGGGR